jgi:hypothetical protein
MENNGGINPFARPPVYEWEQVVTRDELYTLRDNFLQVKAALPARYKKASGEFNGAVKALEGMIVWLEEGKKYTSGVVWVIRGEEK